MNGVFLSGAQPEAAFEKVIDEQLKMAKKASQIDSISAVVLH